jgi:hypothetical protein
MLARILSRSLLLPTVLSTPLLFVGCDRPEGPAEEVGEEIDEAAEEFRDEVDDATTD